MIIDLTKDEKAVLKMIAGEPVPHIAPGAGLWTHVNYLKNIGLLQRQCTPGGITYAISREGERYLRRNP